MIECTSKDEPLISIAMAVYEPRMDWLREQLESLNAQTYPNIELIVRDDCSPTTSFNDICELLKNTITSFAYKVKKNDGNIGSNGTFARLTAEASGKYIAYCDQDDIWLPDKLAKLQAAIEKENAELVCSDMYIIDGKGKKIADSITQIRKRHIFRSGDNLAEHLVYRNFATGCASLMRAETAKAALPFPDSMVHDHWLAVWSAAKGKIFCLPDRLICYRIHENNQTLVLAGVRSREDYFRLRIRPFAERIGAIGQRLSIPGAAAAMEWARAREDYFRHLKGAARRLWKLRHVNRSTSYFELLLLRAPAPIFRLAVRMIRKGVV